MFVMFTLLILAFFFFNAICNLRVLHTHTKKT